MDCPAAREFLSARMDGELPPESEGPLRAHLESCTDCQKAAEDLAALDLELRSRLADPDAAARVASRALAALPAITTLPAAPAPSSRRSSTLLAALAATAVLAASILVLIGPIDHGSPPLGPNQIQITLAKGTINVLPPETSEWRPLSMPAGSLQLVGLQLQTEASSLCEFRCPSGSIVRVDEQTELQVASPTVISLSQGRVWCSASGASSLTVVPTSDGKSPQLKMTCHSAGEMQTTIEPPEPVRVIAARGPVHVADAATTTTLHSGTLANYSAGSWSAPTSVNPQQATEWMLPLLALRGGKDREFSDHVTGLLSRLGTSKLDYVQEERLIDLGSPAALPLLAYLLETPHSADVSKRRRAARIIAQTASEESIPDLIELLNDPLGDVRASAAEALKRLTGLDQGVPVSEWRAEGDAQKAALIRWRDWLKHRPI